MTYDHMAGRPPGTWHRSPSRWTTTARCWSADTNAIGNATDDRVVKYTSDGDAPHVIAGPGAAPGFLLNPTSVTVAPTGGHNIYVVENGGAVRA